MIDKQDNPEHWSPVVLELKERQKQREARRIAFKTECERLDRTSTRARWLALTARIMGSKHADDYIAIAEDRHRQYLDIIVRQMRDDAGIR